jgi:hypothetical protein
MKGYGNDSCVFGPQGGRRSQVATTHGSFLEYHWRLVPEPGAGLRSLRFSEALRVAGAIPHADALAEMMGGALTSPRLPAGANSGCVAWTNVPGSWMGS